MIIIPTYINKTPSISPKPPFIEYQELCDKTDPKPIFCELPNDLGKNNQLSKLFSTNSITASGTVSGATISTIPIDMKYKLTD